jgi:hypothetical protein
LPDGESTAMASPGDNPLKAFGGLPHR